MSSASRHFGLIAPPTPGHLNPLQALGVELVALGHRVTIVHLSDARRFVSDERVGFAPLEEGDGLDRYLDLLAKANGPIGLPRMVRATAAMTDLLLRAAPAVLERIGVDALLADSAEAAGPLLARRLRLPHVVTVSGLPLLREPGVPPPFVGWRYRPGALGQFRNRGGYAVSDALLHPIARVVERHRRTWRLDRVDEGALLHVAQCPRGLDFPRSGLPPRFLYGGPWRLPQRDMPDLPHDGRPLVFCSLGTLQGSRHALFATMAAACAAIGARAVIGHGGGLTAAEAAALPGEPLVRAFWPQQPLLRRCAAAVLHGGFNSVLDALAAGVPIVTVPIAFEQPGTAARLERVGAGRTIVPGRTGVRAMARALRAVITQPAYREAAVRLSAEMKTAGGAAHAASAISAALASS